MYCKYCGSKVDDNARFCPQCGKTLAENGSGRERIKLRCASCNAEMTMDPKTRVIRCDHCGTSEVILDSEAVEIEKLHISDRKESRVAEERISRRQRNGHLLSLLLPPIFENLPMLCGIWMVVVGRKGDNGNGRGYTLWLGGVVVVFIWGLVMLARALRKKK